MNSPVGVLITNAPFYVKAT